MKKNMTNFLRNRLAKMEDDKGIKWLVSTKSRFDDFVFSVIKLSQKQKGAWHPKHEITDFHNFFRSRIEPSDSVLEVGCSVGWLAGALAEHAREVVAIDDREEAVREAEKRWKRGNLKFLNIDFFEMDEGRQFDKIVMSNVLEHIEDRIGFLKKAARLAPVILIRVPAYDRDWMVPYKRRLGLEWRINTDHKIEYTARELEDEIHEAGLTCKELFCQWGNYSAQAIR